MKQTLNRTLCSLLAAAALAAGLSACAPLVVGGAVVGTMMAVDRRTTGTQVEDEGIELRSANRLSELLGDRGHVNVTSFNRQVLLTGEVKDEAMKAAVEREVKAIDGVASVANELTIAGPATYTARANDSLITTKVKASLVDMKTISATSFKVITERGVVYLMGRVTQREGQVAADVARGVSGVNKVVKIFEYITEDEMRALSPQKGVQL